MARGRRRSILEYNTNRSLKTNNYMTGGYFGNTGLWKRYSFWLTSFKSGLLNIISKIITALYTHDSLW